MQLFQYSLVIILGLSFSNVNCIDETDVQFYMYTKTFNTPVALVKGQLSDVILDNSNMFKYIIHGFIDNANVSWIINMKNTFLNKYSNCTVITVNWSKYTSNLVYSVPAEATKPVGEYVAQFLTDMRNTLGVAFSSVHLLGHSLGAHLSGFCGKSLLNTTNDTVARISGFDPAGPEFTGKPASERLASGDAYFVDIIHTDDGVSGDSDVIGDIDFFPNGGDSPQPGCGLETIQERLLRCSHVRSHKYYNESINSLGFVAKACSDYKSYDAGDCSNNSTAIMGENVDQTQRGIFYLCTNSAPPYARNGQLC